MWEESDSQKSIGNSPLILAMTGAARRSVVRLLEVLIEAAGDSFADQPVGAAVIKQQIGQ
jgi:hypothetical protein